MKFYEKTWFLWLALIFFAPLGIFLLYKQKKFGRIPRAILAALFSFVFLIEIAVATVDTPQADQVAQTNQQQQEEIQTPDPSIGAPQESIQDTEEQNKEEQNTENQNTKDQDESVPAVASVAASNPTPSGTLKVHFIDVGQADSILIQSGNTAVLIDAGNNEDGQLVVNYLKAQGVTKLAAVVATHPHEDHIGGMDTVLRTFPVEKFYMPAATSTTKTFEDMIAAVNASGTKRIQAKAGVVLDVPGINGTFLAPVGSGYEDLNNYSAVLKVTFGNTSFLFTGDAEDVSESEMLRNGNLQATVLKVGHHGSDSSTTPEFLKAVSPKYAVISVGKDNSYGHPDSVVLNRLASAGVQIYRTDQSGTIVATSDGSSVSFNASPSAVVTKLSANSTSSNNKPTTTAASSTPSTTKPTQSTVSDPSNKAAVQHYVLNTSTKKFHLPTCSKLPTKNRADRETTREALISEGYSPCKICNP